MGTTGVANRGAAILRREALAPVAAKVAAAARARVAEDIRGRRPRVGAEVGLAAAAAVAEARRTAVLQAVAVAVVELLVPTDAAAEVRVAWRPCVNL